ncbi:hypothetical protein CSAL01_10110 [Colletotrichum salicis]|uniref:Major facilitator superfamily transporter n=1 Tax=Colletotrichum salicis TaxID=1209931 RepID=A0A135U952_9PEZI|nr:hypothetical protein CSAL01_10110 [Colletotrichum salicis]
MTSVSTPSDGRNMNGEASEGLVESAPASTTHAAGNTKRSGLVSSELHGFKLYMVLIGVCFGAFVMALDVYIIGTVRHPANTYTRSLSLSLPIRGQTDFALA